MVTGCTSSLRGVWCPVVRLGRSGRALASSYARHALCRAGEKVGSSSWVDMQAVEWAGVADAKYRYNGCAARPAAEAVCARILEMRVPAAQCE